MTRTSRTSKSDNKSQNYILRREGTGDGLVDVHLFTETGLGLHKATEAPPDADYIFRWGCTASVPRGSERRSVVVNEASAIHKVYDKRNFRLELAAHDLSPKSWGSMREYLANRDNPHDVIVRKNKHSRSEDMWVCEAPHQTAELCEELGKGNYYISELIDKTNEYRVMFVQGRVIGMIEKKPRNKKEVSWGCVDTGEYEYINWQDWPLKVVRMALEAAELSGLDFGAIDIIADKDRPYVLEINSAPWLSPYFCKIFVQAFDYIVKNGKDRIVPVEGNSFHGYIHPSRFPDATIG